MVDEDDEQDSFWSLGVWGAGYATVGVGLLQAARHLHGPVHLVLTALGLLLAAAGGWCLLWFVGFSVLVLVAGTTRGPEIWRALLVVVLLAAFATDWWFFGH